MLDSLKSHSYYFAAILSSILFLLFASLNVKCSESEIQSHDGRVTRHFRLSIHIVDCWHHGFAWNVLLDTLYTFYTGSVDTSNNDASTSARVTMSVMENITTIEFIHQKMNWESHKVAIHFWHQLRVSTIATNHQDNNSSHLALLVTEDDPDEVKSPTMNQEEEDCSAKCVRLESLRVQSWSAFSSGWSESN